MAYNKYDAEKQGGSCMDGIPVKISEQYKPPKRISLPGTILNKLNSHIELPQYDFTLEKSVAEKMSQWRQLRSDQRQARRERIEADRQVKTVTELATEEPAVSPPQTQPCPILTPVPINASIHSQSSKYSNQFNISDFEQDTSSPFDNMELKTLNDLEELAHVLQPIIISDKNKCYVDENKPPPPRLNGYNAQYSFSHVIPDRSSRNHQMAPQNPNPPSCQSYVIQRMDLAGQNSKSVPDIIQQLGAELKGKREAESRISVDQPQRPASIGPTEALSSLPNPYDQLSPSCQRLVDQLAEMGFPLPRVARAAQLFEDDEPRIVEFLVQVQSLEEMNYLADRAEKALVANNYQQQETIQYLKSISQLVDLGFEEDQVERALSECGSDRDKALDLLIS